MTTEQKQHRDFRVNYGNSQVSNAFVTRREAEVYLRDYRSREPGYGGYAFLERYMPDTADCGGGEWLPTKERLHV